MLIRFSVKNFRSIGSNPITLNMVSSSRIQQHPEHVCESNSSVKVLRNAVIYGANASGKTNLFKALLVLVMNVRMGSLPINAQNDFCRTCTSNSEETTVFDIQFENEGRYFSYGFECFLDEPKIVSEWLYLLENSDFKTVFERTEEDIKTALTNSEKDQVRLDVYKEDFLADQDSALTLFLPYLNKGRTFAQDSQLNDVAVAYRWFTQKVQIFDAQEDNHTSKFYLKKNLNDVSRLLASFDTGIADLRKEKITLEEVMRMTPFEHKAVLKEMLNTLSLQADEPSGLIIRADGSFIGIERMSDGSLDSTIMKIKHVGSAFDFDFGDESDGTKRLFDFIDMIMSDDGDVLYVIDELSRSLHPLLTKHFVQLFNKVHANDDSQLIFTTHENDIMSYEFFRRDEIWFIERNENGESKLYPLDEFSKKGLRSDSHVGKQYLEGRYGGIPVLSLEKSLIAIEGE